MRNRFGLDVSYITSGLKILVRDADNYRPDEMGRALRRFANVADPQPEPTSAVPEGYALVPVEPTEAMVSAGYGALPDCSCTEGDMWRAKLVYKAMLAAAPQQGGEG